MTSQNSNKKLLAIDGRTEPKMKRRLKSSFASSESDGSEDSDTVRLRYLKTKIQEKDRSIQKLKRQNA